MEPSRVTNGDPGEAMRRAARATILERYDLRKCLAAQWRLVEALATAGTRQHQVAAAAAPARRAARHDG